MSTALVFMAQWIQWQRGLRRRTGLDFLILFVLAFGWRGARWRKSKLGPRDEICRAAHAA